MFLDLGKLRFTETKRAGALTRHAVAAALFERPGMKQTEHFYIEAGHKVAQAMRQKNLNRSRAAIQNFYFLLALESDADKEEARRLFSRGMNEAQRQH